MNEQPERWRRQIEQILQDLPWSKASAYAQGVAITEAANRRVLATASCFDDEAWEKLDHDFEQLAMELTKARGEATWRHPAPRDPNCDFFAASIDWPPSTQVIKDRVADTKLDLAPAFPDSERVIVWQHDSALVFVALDLLDNTRVRALVVGVMSRER